jgi:hypothetical protein
LPGKKSGERTEPVKISGQAIANLVASTDGTDADWVVKLIDVYPDEVAAQPAMGGYQLMVAADIFRGRYREIFETPKPIEANRALAYRFALPTANHVFLPGHRIMVQVQSSWFPLYDRNPQSFVPNIFWAKPGDYRKAVQRIYHAPGQASYVELPMVVARCEAACGARNPASVISARVEGTPIWALLRRLAGAQSTLYSVVLPSKCSSSFSASARVWWTTPSR